LTYNDEIYVIGGETTEGVAGLVERYTPASDAWTRLAAKPTAVADIGAVAIGGLIYVPGGRLASGDVTDVLEVYDPRRDEWHQRAALPLPLSAYAAVAFEGRLLLFGGWDGRGYVGEAFSYVPDRDAWVTLSALPTARGFAGAALVGGQIYVVGGYDGQDALDVNEAYLPERQDTVQAAWTVREPLPDKRYASGVASLADTLYVVGGETAGNESLASLTFSPQRGTWESIRSPIAGDWSHLGLAVLETKLFAIGGRQGDVPSDLNLAYQAVFTISFPIVK
jgi:N-acetylneuraminic acid mutarotase